MPSHIPNIRRYLVSLIFLFNVAFLSGIEEMNFRRITINDGLSLSSVNYIYQDSKGFMWFATEDGLNKYDGHTFTIYRHTPGDTNSLAHQQVESIMEDRHGNIWLSSGYGLTRLDPSREKMTRFLSSNKYAHRITNNAIRSITEQGPYLWVGTGNGLNRIHTTTLEVQAVDLECENELQTVNEIHVDKNNRIWIGTNEALYVISDPESGARCVVSTEPGEKNISVRSVFTEQDTLWVGTGKSLLKYLLNNEPEIEFKYPAIQYHTHSPVETIFRDSHKDLWVATADALMRYRSKKLVTIVKTPLLVLSNSIKYRKPLIEDRAGNLWLGTFGNGVYKIIAGENRTEHYRHDPANPSSLSDNTINCIFEDRAGGVWLGTIAAGISIFNPGSNLIKTLRHNAFDSGSLEGNSVWAIQEINQKQLWIGTNATGINIYDLETGKFNYLRYNSRENKTVPTGIVREIFQSSEGTIWVGTDEGGLSKYNPADTSFSGYLSIPDNPTTISSNSVRTIFEDSTGILWIGTGRGLNRFDPRTGKFKRFLHDPDDQTTISNNFVYSAIYMDKAGNLWVGTYGGGLNKMDTGTGKFIHYQFDQNNPYGISDNLIFSIHEDDNGHLWIGTNNGLNEFNPNTGRFKRYGMASGLPNEVIYGIMPDNDNHLWMTTNKGISRLNLTDLKFKNFDVRDGLQSNEFNGNAFHRGKSGMLYAGGVYGLNIINPLKIVPVQNSAELIITRMEILGRNVRVSRLENTQHHAETGVELTEIAGNFVLPGHITYMESVRLKYNQRFISIEFAALNHHIPEKLNYRYRMQNLEEHWNNAGNRNFVTYANLKPGTYIFKADALNSDGFPAQKQAQLKIIITPPFWRSYWFMMIIAMTAVAVIIFIYRFLLNQRTNALLKAQFEQIKEANQQLQLSEKNLVELNATKDKFFSIISHDLKNPFASVLSISEMMDENFDRSEPDEMKYGIHKIHETNKHIYDLLENLLTWSKTQRGNIDIEPVKFNLSKIIEINVNLLKLSAEKKNITIHDQSDPQIFVHGDREMISTVFRNLLNNAIKFTPEGKNVTISTVTNKHSITVTIEDQGIGISDEDQLRLFRIDDKFKTEGTAGEQGTGLGLLICKEFIEKNGGTMHVESSVNVGSRFSFNVPLEED